MAMFARRSLQRFLNELKDRISWEARMKIAAEMDRKDPSALGFEWELALIYALSQVGRVGYEAQFAGGARRPDISFEAADGSLRFVADVTTISDAGLEQENPVMRFDSALHQLKRKFGLTGSLHHHVGSVDEGANYRNRKVRLKLPKISELESFLAKHVAPQFKRIAQEKLPIATFAVKEPDVEFQVTYNEGERYSGASYTSFTAAYSLKRNPVYRALKSKRDQLTKSGATAPMGIFLCDGGCTLLSRPGRQHMQFGLDDVIGEFFREHASIAFAGVLVFPPPRAQAFVGIVKEKRITGRIYSNPSSRESLSAASLEALMNRGFALLPAPVATPMEALHWIGRSAPYQGQPIGIITQGAAMVQMSARKIQEVLAGKITAQELFADYSRPGEPPNNPFERALKAGLTIVATKITRVPESDDDLIEVDFGIPDPAIGKFKVG